MVRIVSMESFVAIAAGADARSRTAAFTAKGLLVLEAADSAWGRTQTEIIECFGRDKWAALVSELERLAACARAAQSTEIGPTAPEFTREAPS
jgi:hypothetical protein